MHLLAKAIEKAGSTEGDAIRTALESLDSHEGLIKTYDKPFDAANHDALGPDDYIMVRYEGEEIVPVE
jgi:branched-chain amino acid transport system substrate-binding protein